MISFTSEIAIYDFLCSTKLGSFAPKLAFKIMGRSTEWVDPLNEIRHHPEDIRTLAKSDLHGCLAEIDEDTPVIFEEEQP